MQKELRKVAATICTFWLKITEDLKFVSEILSALKKISMEPGLLNLFSAIFYRWHFQELEKMEPI